MKKKCEMCKKKEADPKFPLDEVQACCKPCGVKWLKGMFAYMHKWNINGFAEKYDENCKPLKNA